MLKTPVSGERPQVNKIKITTFSGNSKAAHQ